MHCLLIHLHLRDIASYPTCLLTAESMNVTSSFFGLGVDLRPKMMSCEEAQAFVGIVVR